MTVEFRLRPPFTDCDVNGGGGAERGDPALSMVATRFHVKLTERARGGRILVHLEVVALRSETNFGCLESIWEKSNSGPAPT